jgi:hypothetical protein
MHVPTLEPKGAQPDHTEVAVAERRAAVDDDVAIDGRFLEKLEGIIGRVIRVGVGTARGGCVGVVVGWWQENDPGRCDGAGGREGASECEGAATLSHRWRSPQLV